MDDPFIFCVYFLHDRPSVKVSLKSCKNAVLKMVKNFIDIGGRILRARVLCLEALSQVHKN